MEKHFQFLLLSTVGALSVGTLCYFRNRSKPSLTELQTSISNENTKTEAESVQEQSNAVNILCLDGGGMRGLIELQILEAIEKELRTKYKAMNKELPKDWVSIHAKKLIIQIRHHFQLICGTSTGAILALSLGLLGKSLSEAKEAYLKLGDRVFKNTRETGNLFSRIAAWLQAQTAVPTKWLDILKSADGLYNTNELEKALAEFLPKDKKMSQYTGLPKVFVVTTDGKKTQPEPFVLRNYQIPVTEHNGNITESNQCFLYGTDDWTPFEAARASSAGPYYFKPFLKQPTQTSLPTVYVDGGIVANNPSELAMYEFAKLFPNAKLNLVLSIGTGKVDHDLQLEERSLMLWANSIYNLPFDSERIHQNFQRWYNLSKGAVHYQYIRLNPPKLGGLSLAACSATDIAKMHQYTKDYLGESDRINRLKQIRDLLCPDPQHS